MRTQKLLDPIIYGRVAGLWKRTINLVMVLSHQIMKRKAVVKVREVVRTISRLVLAGDNIFSHLLRSAVSYPTSLPFFLLYNNNTEVRTYGLLQTSQTLHYEPTPSYLIAYNTIFVILFI